MTGDPERRLSAALRAQAAGLGAGVPVAGEAVHAADPGVRSPTIRPGPRLPAWTVLALAVLLGATAGGLAGVISAW